MIPLLNCKIVTQSRGWRGGGEGMNERKVGEFVFILATSEKYLPALFVHGMSQGRPGKCQIKQYECGRSQRGSPRGSPSWGLSAPLLYPPLQSHCPCTDLYLAMVCSPVLDCEICQALDVTLVPPSHGTKELNPYLNDWTTQRGLQFSCLVVICQLPCYSNGTECAMSLYSVTHRHSLNSLYPAELWVAVLPRTGPLQMCSEVFYACVGRQVALAAWLELWALSCRNSVGGCKRRALLLQGESPGQTPYLL
jgi:hypothetical protein